MNVLFIGNSHTYYNELQDMFAVMVKAGTGEEIHSVRCTAPGVALSWHCDNQATHKAIAEREWDYVILQDRSGAPVEVPEEMFCSAENLHDEIKKSSPKAEVVLYMTWANRLRPQDQEIVTGKYYELQQKLNCKLAAVGQIWERAFDQIDGLVLHDADNSHANPFGTYLASCVFYTTIIGKSPVGLPSKIEANGKVLAEVPEKLALRLQQVADSIRG